MNGYKIVCEVVSGNPNVDMLIIRPYLYIYIKKENVDGVVKNGLSGNDDGKIEALFTRLPEKQYASYLEDHAPVKISVSKLTKIKDQKVVIRPVNFEYEKDSLTEDDIQSILDKSSKKLRSLFDSNTKISDLPRVDIEFSGESLPAFAIKVLDVDES